MGRTHFVDRFPLNALPSTSWSTQSCREACSDSADFVPQVRASQSGSDGPPQFHPVPPMKCGASSAPGDLTDWGSACGRDDRRRPVRSTLRHGLPPPGTPAADPAVTGKPASASAQISQLPAPLDLEGATKESDAAPLTFGHRTITTHLKMREHPHVRPRRGPHHRRLDPTVKAPVRVPRAARLHPRGDA